MEYKAYLLKSILLLSILLLLNSCTSDDEQKLINVYIPDNYIYRDGEIKWVILSDHQGNLLDAHAVQNNSVVVFTMPADFDQEKIMVTEFSYLETFSSTKNITRNIQTFSDVPVKDLHLMSGALYEPEPDQGTVKINVTNAPDLYDINVSGTDILATYNDRNGSTYNLTTHLSKEKADVLITLYNHDNKDAKPKYKLFTDTKNGDEHTISLSTFEDMNEVLIPVEEGITPLYHQHVGFRPGTPI